MSGRFTSEGIAMKLSFARAVAALVVLGFAGQAAAASPIGTWKTIDDETKRTRSLVKIYKKANGKLFGKIIKLYQQPSEPKNPVCDKCKGANKNKPIVGMNIIRGLELDDDEWGGGTILDPGNGKTYSCKIWIEGGGKKLKLRGYVGFFYRTQYWYRVK